MYHVLKSGDDKTIIKSFNGINWSVPVDESNYDYQTYKKWLSEGNEPEVIDLNND